MDILTKKGKQYSISIGNLGRKVFGWMKRKVKKAFAYLHKKLAQAEDYILKKLSEWGEKAGERLEVRINGGVFDEEELVE